MRRCLLSALPLCSLLLVGCGPVNLPAPSEYTFSAHPDKIVSSGSQGPSILVLMPGAGSGYQSNKMLYMMTPFELQSYTKSTWAAPPAKMMVSILVNSLRKSGHFKAVAAPPFLAKTDCQLAIYLEMLHQSFMRPVSQVQLVLHATLTRSLSHRVLAGKTITRRFSAPGNNAYSGVIATNKAIHSASREVARFASKYCSK